MRVSGVNACLRSWIFDSHFSSSSKKVEMVMNIISSGRYEKDWTPDSLNSTRFINHTKDLEWFNGGNVIIEIEDEVELSIPSGNLKGRVVDMDVDTEIDTKIVIKLGNTVWDGKYAGMDNGMSGIFGFEVDIPDDYPIKTSAYSVAIPYRMYVKAREIVNEFGNFYNQPFRKRKALKRVIDVIMNLDTVDMEEYVERGIR